jgi:hypothetical protein
MPRILSEEIILKKFGKLRIKIPQDITSGSAKKIEWICDCGKEKLIQISCVLSGLTSSCGQCNQISAEEIATKKFGKLRIKTPQDILPGSHKKISWICDCGGEITTRINLVLSGQSTSCGHCNLISASEMAIKKFGKLRIKIPQNITSGSAKKIEWICDCGKETIIKICEVLNGHSISCGQCNLITASEIATKKFGKLRIKTPQDVLPGSTKKIEWICDCGKEKNIGIKYVLCSVSTSCGLCNLISAEEISKRKFCKLRIKEPQDILPGSKKKIIWICDCGKEKLIKTCLVISNNTKSCGNCGELVKNWYIQNREQIRALKCPIDTKDFIPGGIIPLETIKNTGNPFKAICPACQKIYHPMLDNIKQGRSLTCGCCEFRISMPVIQITEYIRSLGFEVQNEFKVSKLAYDIFIPQKNLLIEFQGTKWHSSEKSKERDLRKKQNALNNGYEFKEILEKDWNTKRDEIENNLMVIKNVN